MNRYKYIDDIEILREMGLATPNQKTAHVHVLDSKPLIGTSTAMKIVGKGDAFSWWAAGKAVETLGWMNSKVQVDGKYKTISKEDRLAKVTPVLENIKTLTPDSFLDLLDTAYKAHDVSKKESGKKGTIRHEMLEIYVKECMKQGGKPLSVAPSDPSVQKFVDWAVINVKRFLWSELHCYSEVLWVGGIGDVGMELHDGNIIVGDFKSSKEAYAEQFWQCATYGMEITENGGFDKDGNKIFTLEKSITGYAVIPFGADEIVPSFCYDVEGCQTAAKAAITLFKASQNFVK